MEQNRAERIVDGNVWKREKENKWEKKIWAKNVLMRNINVIVQSY